MNFLSHRKTEIELAALKVGKSFLWARIFANGGRLVDVVMIKFLLGLSSLDGRGIK